MCLICVEYEKGKLKIGEAIKNLSEMRELIGEDHAKEVEHKLMPIWENVVNKYRFICDDEYWEHFGFGD
jgi:hypothetical protein